MIHLIPDFLRVACRDQKITVVSQSGFRTVGGSDRLFSVGCTLVFLSPTTHIDAIYLIFLASTVIFAYLSHFPWDDPNSLTVTTSQSRNIQFNYSKKSFSGSLFASHQCKAV
jgi:hypothetical protein